MKKLTILIPTDFSVQAEYAYLMVKKLAIKVPVEIHFVHVLAVPDTITLKADGTFDTCGEVDIRYLQQQKEMADRKLQSLVSTDGPPIHTHLLLGKITDTILDFSLNQHIDLIVIGTKGAWGIKEKLSGSEAEAIDTRSTIPVLSLMCDRSDLEINNILLAHDFNSHRTMDVSLLQKLLKAFNSTLHLLQFVSGDDAIEKLAIIEKMNLWAKNHEISAFECHVVNDVNIEQAVVHFNQMHPIDIVTIGIHEQHGIFKQ
ncbi:MAG: universal stress protein, partial [Ferruginibacter sp.]